MKWKCRAKVTLYTWVLAFVLVPWASVNTISAQELFSHQESMVYNVEYGPARLAELGLKVDCLRSGKVGARLLARSQGMARSVHPFQVRLDTIVGIEEGSSRQAQTWIEEKGQIRRYRSRFDLTPRVVTTSRFRGEESRDVIALPGASYDLLSWMLHLRQKIAQSGPRSQRSRYLLWDGWKLVWLDIEPGSVEEMWTPVGDVRVQGFDLRRTRIYHRGEQRFRPRAPTEKLGTIWIEISPRALPVAMTFHAPIGRVRIDIMEYRSGECEME